MSVSCPHRQASCVVRFSLIDTIPVLNCFNLAPSKKKKKRVGGKLTCNSFSKSVEFTLAEFVPLFWAVNTGFFHMGHLLLWWPHSYTLKNIKKLKLLRLEAMMPNTMMAFLRTIGSSCEMSLYRCSTAPRPRSVILFSSPEEYLG